MGIDDSNSALHIAIRQQEKFQFYFASLTFTLLALAIQTAALDRSTVERLLELGGWLALAIAGLAALRRLESEPRLRVLWHAEERRPRDVEEAKVTKLRQEIDRLEIVQRFSYPVARYGFLCGLALIMASRSATAVVDLFGYVLT